MKTLTLDQVKQVGRFAWTEDGVYADGNFLRLHLKSHVDEVGNSIKSESTFIALFADIGWFEPVHERSLSRTGRGWHHLPGCHCEFCYE